MFDVEGARKAGYTDAEIAQFMAGQSGFDLNGAKKSGYSDGEVIAHLSKMGGASNSAQQLARAQFPDGVEGDKAFAASQQGPGPAPEPTLGDKLVGAGEAGLSALTGITGVAGGAVGLLQGLSNAITNGTFGTDQGWKDINAKMGEYANALTYTPKTSQGQEQAQALGQAMIPLAGMAPQLADMAGGVPQMAMARPAANVVLDKARSAVPAAIEKVRQVESTPTPGTLGSAGAAATDMATQRQALAESFGIPKLTSGQATRDPMQLKFERETAKTEVGAPLRERNLAQEQAVRARLDSWVDATGAEKPMPYDAGMYIDDVLQKQYAKDKARVRTEYETAKKSPEAQAPIDLSRPVNIGDGDAAMSTSVLDYLNSKPTGVASTSLTDYAKKSAVKLGIATEDEAGNLVSSNPTMAKVQDWRREISQSTNWSDSTQVQQSTVLKKLIDATADPVAGPLFQRARSARIRLAQNYENHRVISDLLGTKRGTADRKVAFEKVTDHIIRGSVDDVHQARRILQRAGPEGHQAWAEVRGQTLRWIRNEAENFTKDSTGNKVISPRGLNDAIESLDAGGSEVSKLTLIFGKKGAQQLRDINSLVQDIKTVPPEAAVNMSNTAATMLSAFGDVAISGVFGIPAPVATSVRMINRYVKDAKLRRRILEALGEVEAKQKAKPPAAPAPQEQVLH